MKLYTFYSETHSLLYNNYFLDSLKNTDYNKFELITKVVPQRSATGSFESEGWRETMNEKIELLLDATNDNWGNWFVFADCDIQFLKPFYEDLKANQDDKMDIIAQSDLGTLCAGFFMGKAGHRLRNLLNKMYNNHDKHRNDQLAMNAYKDAVTWKLFDTDKYFTIANVNGGKVWEGETDLELPPGILMHHANFTIGVENKVKLLEFVKHKQR